MLYLMRNGIPFPKLKSGECVRKLILQMYGPKILTLNAGLTVHVTACYANHNAVSKENEYYTMRINEYTPKSDWDWFVLNLSRSFADLSIISGSLLRAESQLSCRIQGQPHFVASLQEFRKEIGKRTKETSVALITNLFTPSSKENDENEEEISLQTSLYRPMREIASLDAANTIGNSRFASTFPLNHQIFNEMREQILWNEPGINATTLQNTKLDSPIFIYTSESALLSPFEMSRSTPLSGDIAKRSQIRREAIHLALSAIQTKAFVQNPPSYSSVICAGELAKALRAVFPLQPSDLLADDAESILEEVKNDVCSVLEDLYSKGVKLIVVPQSSLRALIKTAADFGYKGIDIEVGPTAAAALYDTPEDVPVQAILLSTYHKQFTPQMCENILISAKGLEKNEKDVNVDALEQADHLHLNYTRQFTDSQLHAHFDHVGQFDTEDGWKFNLYLHKSLETSNK